jgi:hypothetical protein
MIRNAFLIGMIGLAGFITGCGGGGAGGTTATTTTTTPAAAGAPSMTVALTDNAVVPNAISTLSAGITGVLTATVRDQNGLAVPNALVTFSTDSAFGTFNPASGTTLTNASGLATLQISAGATSGASTVNVAAVWKENGTDVRASGGVNYIVSAGGVVAGLGINAPVLGINTLSAYGTTSIQVTVTGATAPLNVSFTSPCATSGKAILTPSVTTIGNIAIASYRDNGCGNTDIITASLTTGVSASSTLNVTAPSASSIQYLSATPEVITLKGTGSATAPETSTVKFKVLDTLGNPISRTVNFSLNTTLGGITFSNGLTTASATSDATSGEVQIGVNSGTLPTPVRVLATISGTTIQTQSNQLTVSTGLPDQAHTSLSASIFNIDGLRFDGTTSVISINLADHFSNPVPDGTVVNFVAEGARVGSSCTTVDSTCSVTFTSQDLRPTDGRVTVLAFAVGEESFTDLNSNGTVDNAGEMIDSNGDPADMGEAFVDFDEDGIRDAANEPFFDFDNNGSFRSAGDLFYNGILCTAGAAICSATKSLHVNKSLVMVLSDSHPRSPSDIFSGRVPAIPLDLGGCANRGGAFSFNLLLRDLNNNPLPAGTTVTVSSTNGRIDLGASMVVPNSNDRYDGTQNQSSFNFPVTIVNDAPTTGVCADPTLSGVLTVSITAPRGGRVNYTISVFN